MPFLKNFLNPVFVRRAAVLATLVLAGGAHAHITLEQKSAPAGSTYKAVFRVGHGCAGAATTKMTWKNTNMVAKKTSVPQSGWSRTPSSLPVVESGFGAA